MPKTVRPKVLRVDSRTNPKPFWDSCHLVAKLIIFSTLKILPNFFQIQVLQITTKGPDRTGKKIRLDKI